MKTKPKQSPAVPPAPEINDAPEHPAIIEARERWRIRRSRRAPPDLPPSPDVAEHLWELNVENVTREAKTETGLTYLHDHDGDNTSLVEWKTTGRQIVERIVSAGATEEWTGSIRMNANTRTFAFNVPGPGFDYVKVWHDAQQLARLRYAIEHYSENCYDNSLYREIVVAIGSDRLADEKEKTLADSRNNGKKSWSGRTKERIARDEQYRKIRTRAAQLRGKDPHYVQTLISEGLCKKIGWDGEVLDEDMSDRQVSRIINPKSPKKSR